MEYVVALVQGIYFFVTGVWPLISMKTFLKITGPKTDLWLVKTVGVILAVIGIVLIVAQVNAEINTSIIILAIGSGLGLAIVEFIYVAKRVISPIYLGDAFAEIVLIAWWVLSIALSN
jgi:hypothetical protein